MTKADIAAMDWLDKFNDPGKRHFVGVTWPWISQSGGHDGYFVALWRNGLLCPGKGKTLAAATRRARKALREAKDADED